MNFSLKLNEQNLGMAIVKGACNPEISDVSVELMEIGLDHFMDDGLLKEIPVLKTIVACHKSWETIHDQLFLRKVARFLLACPKFSQTEREAFLSGQLLDSSNAKRLGEALVLVIGRLDDLEKPAMLAKVFAAMVRGQITYDQFRRLARGVDNGYADDLGAFASLPLAQDVVAESLLMPLLPSGFSVMHAGATRFGSIGSELHITKLGRLFQKCIQEQFV